MINDKGKPGDGSSQSIRDAKFYSPNFNPLVILPWRAAGCPYSGGCVEMEFCVFEFTKYAFRLPGQPCHPGRGPVIRMVPGKKYQITLRNTGVPTIERHTTGLHVHGLHVSPLGNSDNLVREVPPGQCAKYTFDIPANHMGGTHWYYAFRHRNTQIMLHGGAVGMIIIEDSPNFGPFPSAPIGSAAASQHQQVRTFLSNELLLFASKLEQENVVDNFFNLYLGNGYARAPVAMNANQWYRLRVAAMEQGGRPGEITFGCGECQVHALAIDGVYGFSVPLNTQSKYKYEIISRIDVAIRCPAGQFDVRFFGGPVARLISTGGSSYGAISSASPFVSSGTWMPSRPSYLEDLRQYTGPLKRASFYITDGYINGVAWNPDVPLLDGLQLDDVVEWQLKSTGSGPLHLQTYPMQVVTRGGCGWHQEGLYYDVISAVSGRVGQDLADHLIQAPDGPLCTVRFRIKDFGGRVVMRSEYFEIGDWGSMGWIRVQGGAPADLTDIRPLGCLLAAQCVLDGSCTPQFECDSDVGRDNCGGPCLLPKPLTCPSGRRCDTITNKCTAQPDPLAGLPPPLSIPKPTSTLLPIVWRSTNCLPTYDFCGDIEFCTIGITQFGFRQPGQPCRPLKSPVIRMLPGKKYMMYLHNTGTPGVKEHTNNIHTHGIHVSGDGNADDITREVHPGFSLRYTWKIPATHLGGTFWYHAHVHELTKRQVSGGALGMLIIEDPVDFAPTPRFQLWLDNELLLVASRVGDVFRGNGNPNEVIPMIVGMWYRLRIVGADPEVKPKDIIIANPFCDVHRMQHDGVWNTLLPANVVSRHTWTLTGASRLEMAIRCSTEGTYDVFWFGGTVAKLVVGPSPNARMAAGPNPFVVPGGQWNNENKRPVFLQDLRNYQGPIKTYPFVIKHGFINEISYNPKVPLFTIPFGGVVDFLIRGSAGHAFHHHVWHMQVITPGGCGFHEEGQWYDIISRDTGGDCRVRIPLLTYMGRTTLHCHYLEHEDAGTMGWNNIINGPPIDFAYLPEIPTSSVPRDAQTGGNAALVSGLEVVGAVVLDMSGTILQITTNVIGTYILQELQVYIGASPVPSDYFSFPFVQTRIAVTKYTFSADITRYGVPCPSTWSPLLNIAVRAVVTSTSGLTTLTAWARSTQSANSFQFKPSCYASRQSPFFVRRGILRFDQPFSVQIDPSVIPAGQRPAPLPRFGLQQRTGSAPGNCRGVTPIGTTTLSEDGQSWVLTLSTGIAGGQYDICLIGTTTVAFRDALWVAGLYDAQRSAESCLTTSPSHLTHAVESAFQVNTITAESWWLVQGANCTWPPRGSVYSSDAPTGTVPSWVGVASLCYEQQDIAAETPICISLSSEEEAFPTSEGEVSSKWPIWVGVAAGVTVAVVFIAGLGCCCMRRAKQAEPFDAKIFEPAIVRETPTFQKTPRQAMTRVGPSPRNVFEFSPRNPFVTGNAAVYDPIDKEDDSTEEVCPTLMVV